MTPIMSRNTQKKNRKKSDSVVQAQTWFSVASKGTFLEAFERVDRLTWVPFAELGLVCFLLLEVDCFLDVLLTIVVLATCPESSFSFGVSSSNVMDRERRWVLTKSLCSSSSSSPSNVTSEHLRFSTSPPTRNRPNSSSKALIRVCNRFSSPFWACRRRWTSLANRVARSSDCCNSLRVSVCDSCSENNSAANCAFYVSWTVKCQRQDSHLDREPISVWMRGGAKIPRSPIELQCSRQWSWLLLHELA